jgi:3-hydroxyisobutyrate dehydrogenase-like beta-hydroxyacid dehydrogenase
VDLAIKDVKHAVGLAAASGAKLPGMEIALGHLEAVKEHQGKTGDIAGIYGAVRKESGLPFENGPAEPR